MTALSRSVLVVAIAVMLTPSVGLAKIVHLACHDGVVERSYSAIACGPADVSYLCSVSCDADNECDRICTFTVPVCDATCSRRAFHVHVGHRKKLRFRAAIGAKPTTLVARCVRHPHGLPCPTTTTTTSTTTTMTSITSCTSLFCSPALSFTTASGAASCGGAGLNPPASAPSSGAIFSDTAKTTKIDDLGLGCLYIGGGKETTLPPSLIPDGATMFFPLSGSMLVPQWVSGPASCTAGAGPEKHCINAYCRTDADCDGTFGSCSGGACATPGRQPVPLQCSADADCGGSLGSCGLDANCFFGAPLPISTPPPNEALTTCVLNVIQTDASGTADVSTGNSNITIPLASRVYMTGNAASPCPKCISGLCTEGGEDTGHPCVTTSNLLTSLDCRPPLASFQAPLLITPMPLTSGTASRSATDGIFCPGQLAGNPGAFGQPTTRDIEETGIPAGDVSDHMPHPSVLAAVFCIPKTGNVAVDGVASLPGPGALGIRTLVQLSP